MSATIRITCNYAIPQGWEWAGRLNNSFHPPHGLVDGQEIKLKWNGSTDIEVAAGQRHKLEVYFRVFDVLRMCGAEAGIEPLRDGQTKSYQYEVELKDRYLNRGHLRSVD
ncbi:MAG: hypothetical protein HY290_17570 [Planctomycetia bacterium]|nr:hypothetical protein [Planctomycetia bacterium]